jgi:hypothetical protein
MPRQLPTNALHLVLLFSQCFFYFVNISPSSQRYDKGASIKADCRGDGGGGRLNETIIISRASHAVRVLKYLSHLPTPTSAPSSLYSAVKF